MKLITNSEVDKNKWANFLLSKPYVSPFQTYDFYKLCNSIANFSADVFAVENNNKYIALVVVTIQNERHIKSFFSRRGIIYGCPIVDEEFVECTTFLFNQLINRYKSSLIYLEIRNYNNFSQHCNLLINQGWQYLPYMDIKIILKNRKLKDILADMKYNRRRQISIALEMNARYKKCETEQELLDLYRILAELYKNRVKLPLPNYQFFHALWKSEIGKVFVVIHENQVIGGSFCAVLKNRSIYTMYYCGLRDYNKKIIPTHLAVLAAIDYGINDRMDYLDFMGAGLKWEDYGVRKYKQEFGGVLNEVGRYRSVLRPTLFNIGLKGIEIMKRLHI